MINVADLAQQKLREYLEQNNIESSIRVALMSGGCSGASLGLALDEKKEGDEVAEFEGLTVLIDKTLLTQCDKVYIDYIDADARSGFSITSTNPVGGGGGCGGSCSSCG